MARLGEWIDVSVPVRSGMVHWPGDPEVRLERTKSIAEGEEANLTRVSMSAHTGTHMDAPLHFFEDDPGIETFPLDIALGRARVVLIEGEEPIDRGHVEELDLQSGERVVFRTTNSDRRWWEREFNPKFVHVSVEAAELLGEVGVALVGVDYLSVGGYRTDGAETHRALLGAGVWVVEGLDLSEVEPGDYDLICLPVKLVGGDGAPARVLLRAVQALPPRERA
jgi:arylformamidase